MTWRRYEPIGTLRRLWPRLAGVTKDSVFKEVAVAVEAVRARGVSVRVTVNPEDAEASDMDSLSDKGDATRIEASKYSSREGRSTERGRGECINRAGEGNGDG